MVFRFLTIAALAAFSVLGAQATPTPPQCSVYNVCYIIDESGSIDDAEYQQEEAFVVRISNEIETTSAADTFNSAVVFSDLAETIQTPTQDLAVFQQSVQGSRRFRGGTTISTGLNQCTSLLESAQGDNKVIALITDGRTRPSDISVSNQAAEAAKAAGVDIITVGIGSSVSQDFLMGIASDPSLYINANFDNLDQRVPEVVQAICDTVIPKACKVAFDECEFTFSDQAGLATFEVSEEPDTAFTTRVVPKDVSFGLGVLNTNNIVPEFINDVEIQPGATPEARPITEFGSQSFTPTHFKPYWIAQERGSGIGHQTFQGNQAQEARGRCVRIYFTHYQEIRENRVVNRNNVPRSANKCVVFRTFE
eukprot:TRINITY_DN5077_c0_g1_i1.p1 TRINITY_DN5077_c0_g1~~TRINITY_DN5077_c0_g1_i1.p1  ORF type:complete len:365 (-),score=56.91 TRINITY_DN5077_c0_g1_i1:490-1584(-)